jgi:hypothetical protein
MAHDLTISRLQGTAPAPGARYGHDTDITRELDRIEQALNQLLSELARPAPPPANPQAAPTQVDQPDVATRIPAAGRSLVLPSERMPRSAIPGASGTPAQPMDTYDVPGSAQRKREILDAAASMQPPATDREKSIALAIANQETEGISNNYRAGDGKSGGAYNVSPFKMNVAQLKKIDPAVDPQQVHQDLGLATRMLVTGLRTQGIDHFLMEHRGGSGAIDGSIPQNHIDDYVSGIKDVAAQIQANPSFMNSDARIKKDISAI